MRREPCRKEYKHKREREGKTNELMPTDLGSISIVHEPPRVSKDGGTSDVYTDDHVSEKEPSRDERLGRISGRRAHDGMVRAVETESGSGQTITMQGWIQHRVKASFSRVKIEARPVASKDGYEGVNVRDEVHPKQLDRDQSLRHAEQNRQEDPNNVRKPPQRMIHICQLKTRLVSKSDGRDLSTHETTSPMLDEMRYRMNCLVLL